MKYHTSTNLGSEEISHRKNSGPQVQPRTVPAPWLVGPVAEMRFEKMYYSRTVLVVWLEKEIRTRACS